MVVSATLLSMCLVVIKQNQIYKNTVRRNLVEFKLGNRKVINKIKNIWFLTSETGLHV